MTPCRGEGAEVKDFSRSSQEEPWGVESEFEEIITGETHTKSSPKSGRLILRDAAAPLKQRKHGVAWTSGSFSVLFAPNFSD